MNKCLYELKFPKPHDFFNSEFLTKLYSLDRTKGYNFTVFAKDIVNPEYINVKGNDLRTAWIFICNYSETGFVTRIHTDILEGHENKYKSVVGFNYILSGPGVYNFWDKKNLIAIEPETKTWGDVVDTDKNRTPFFTANTEPDQSYNVQENKAYLFNAGVPHGAISIGNRICVSLRWPSSLGENQTWDDVVNLMSDYII